MNQYKDYREAMKSYRRTQNFARHNFAFPFVIPALASVLPVLKIIASLMLLFSFSKEVVTLIFKKVPYFFSRLWEYKKNAKQYVKEQEKINQMRSQVMESQKKLQRLIKEVGRELGRIMKTAGYYKYNSTIQALDQLDEWMDSDEYQAILDGKPLTEQEVQRQASILQQFMKSYEEAHPEKPRGFVRGLVVSMFPAAGYLTGGPEAINKLSADLLAKTPTLAQGSLARFGAEGAVKGLGAATKLNAAFFSVPMVCVSLGTMLAGGIANSVLTSKVEELAHTMANGGKRLEDLAEQDRKLNSTIQSFKTSFNNDINEVREVLKNDTSASASNKEAILKQLDALQTKLATNFSLLTETAGSLVKTGTNLLKNKTFDTAMLGLIAGMAIEKYKNKKEEELANKLLSEEAAKMKKFKFN